MDAPLRFGVRHPLHAVHAALELQTTEHAITRDGRDDLFVTAHFAFGDAFYLDLPSPGLGITLVHAEQIAGEEGGLVAAGSGPDLQDRGGVLVPVARRQQQRHLVLEVGQAQHEVVELLAGQRRHLGIVAAKHLLQARCLGAGAGQFLHGVSHGPQLGVLLGQSHDLGPIGRGAHARLHLVKTIEHRLQLGLG